MADGLEKNTQRSTALNVVRGRIPSPSRARPRGAQTALSPVSDKPQRAGRAWDARDAQAPTRCARSGRASGAARPIAGLPHLPAYQRRAAEGARPKPRSHWLRRHRPDPAVLCRRQRATEAPGLAPPGPTTTPASPAGSRGASTLLGPPPPSVLRPVRSSSNSRLSSCSRKLDRRPDCCPASFPRVPQKGRKHSHHQQVPENRAWWRTWKEDEDAGQAGRDAGARARKQSWLRSWLGLRLPCDLGPVSSLVAALAFC